eukprot:TCALIF_13579-PA protein Name:"Similar to Nynrin Protein NYNRIN (Mus musculus)" AED:0.48 eAED:0.48 QI:0/0/0/0.2/1/1/5/0/529
MHHPSVSSPSSSSAPTSESLISVSIEMNSSNMPLSKSSRILASSASRSPISAKVMRAKPKRATITGKIKFFMLIGKKAKDDINYQAVVSTLLSGQSPKSLPQSHPSKLLSKQWGDLSFDEETGLLILQGHRIFLPAGSRSDVLTSLHASHQGIRCTRTLARSLYLWPGMNNHIEQVVSSCSTCQLHLPSQQPEPLVHSTSSRPFESVSVDLFESAGAHYLIMVDRFSGWPCISRLGWMDTRAVTDILRDWFVDYGVPQFIHSDGGPQFRSDGCLIEISEVSSLAVDIAAAQAFDPELADSSRWLPYIERDANANGSEILVDTRFSRRRPLFPVSVHKATFKAFHKLAHAGVAATKRLLANRFSWSNLATDVAAWVRDCLPCQAAKSDLGYSPAELVYDAPLNLPNAYFQRPTTSTFANVDVFVDELRPSVGGHVFTPAAWHRGSAQGTTTGGPPRLLKGMDVATHVWERVDLVRRPLECPYRGLYRVVSWNDKFFVVLKNGAQASISMERLKPAFGPLAILDPPSFHHR